MNALTNLRTAILAVLVVIGLPGLALAHEKTVPSEGLADLAVLSLSGEVELICWDKPEVKVEWTADDPEQKPSIEAEGGRLWVGKGADHKRRLTTDLRIQLPRGLKVEVETISGDVTVTCLGAGGRIKSVSGQVKARKVRGGLTVKTVSGDVDLRDVSGDLEIKSVSGEIDLDRVDAPLLEAKTVSGDIEMRGPIGKARVTSHSGEVHLTGALKAGGGLRAKSFSGDLTLVLPADSGFDLDAKTRSGDARCEFELSGGERASNKVSGRVGQGGVELELESFSGEIQVKKAQ